MTDYRDLEQQLSGALGLERRPVAVTFLENPPAELSQFTGTVPSGCSFWRLAAEGRTFYTVPSDHYNCPIGSYTHNFPLPEERVKELDQTLSLMTSVGYIKMEEIPGIYRLPRTPGVVIYAPLGDTPVNPDVVLVAGRPGRLMLLGEAALAAGVGPQAPLLGRPTCMALPAAMAHGVVASTGCIGNRVYTDLGEDELYVVIPGKDLAKVVDHARTIAAANAQLADTTAAGVRRWRQYSVSNAYRYFGNPIYTYSLRHDRRRISPAVPSARIVSTVSGRLARLRVRTARESHVVKVAAVHRAV